MLNINRVIRRLLGKGKFKHPQYAISKEDFYSESKVAMNDMSNNIKKTLQEESYVAKYLATETNDQPERG